MDGPRRRDMAVDLPVGRLAGLGRPLVVVRGRGHVAVVARVLAVVVAPPPDVVAVAVGPAGLGLAAPRPQWEVAAGQGEAVVGRPDAKTVDTAAGRRVGRPRGRP